MFPMNTTKPRRLVLWCACGGTIVVTIIIASILYRRLGHAKLPIAALAIQQITLEGAAPVSGKIIDFNHLRVKAGLSAVQPTWQVVSCGLRMVDGPLVTVVIDERKKPALVILEHFLQRQEFSVSNYKLSGNAAAWIGAPPRIFITEQYAENQCNGVTTYFSEQGTSICSCLFRKDAPWSGRTLQRDDFGRIDWDVTYKEGNLEGKELYYSDGVLQRLRTFKQGQLHGLYQDYYQGILRNETLYEDGVRRAHRSYHSNGRLESEEHYLSSGASDGIRRKWDQEGRIEIDQNYSNGREHGRFWERGHAEVWFWRGKFCSGKADFDAREAAANR
jgi:hypothetical protein